MLEAYEMWIWRKMENISWSEHVTNKQVLTMVGEQRSLVDTIRRRRRNWIGHILRGNSLLRTVMEGNIDGRNTRERPRMKLLDGIMTTGNTKLSYSEVKLAAQDGTKWRHRSQNLPPQAENYRRQCHSLQCVCQDILCKTYRVKKWVFLSWQKDAVFVVAWMDAGRLFHTAGPAWLNASSPETVFNLGILK